MKKVLITGAGGYIGSIATYQFLKKGYRVVAVDNFCTGFRKPLEVLTRKFGDESLIVYDKNLADDISYIFKQHSDITAVVHYAAFCSVNESMQHPGRYFSNNTCATHNLIRTMVDHNVKNIVFSSTCATYGDAQYVPINEDHPTFPQNPYGESKHMSETIMQWYAQLKGLRYIILRYFNVCGASDDGLIGDSKKPSPHLMQNAVRGALGIEPFQLTCGKFDTPDGTPIRDYVNVADLNDAHVKALEYLENGGESEIINLGTGTGNSVLEIVNVVQTITGKKFEIEPAEARKGESPKLIASTKKAEEVLDWRAQRSIEDSVKSMVTWYTDNPKGWEG